MRTVGDIRRDIKETKATLRQLAKELKTTRPGMIVDFDAGMPSRLLMEKHGLTYSGLASALFRKGRSFTKRDGLGAISRLKGRHKYLYAKLRKNGIGRAEAYKTATSPPL